MGCGLCTKNFLKLSLLATPTVVHRKAASICNSSHGSILQMQNLRPTQNFWIKTCILIRFPTWISLCTFSSVQFTRSVMSKSLLPHGLQHSRPPCPSPTPGAYSNSWPLVMPSKYLILCHPLLLLPPILPSIRVFSNESVLRIRWPKYWSFSFNISPSNEHSGLISFRMDWLDLLAVQGTLKSLLQHHSSKASILRHSAFFIVQLSHPYMTTGNSIALTRQMLAK